MRYTSTIKLFHIQLHYTLTRIRFNFFFVVIVSFSSSSSSSYSSSGRFLSVCNMYVYFPFVPIFLNHCLPLEFYFCSICAGFLYFIIVYDTLPY